MNRQERFSRVFDFHEVDRVPDYEFGYWKETINRWHQEGLPTEKKTHRAIELHLDLEGWESVAKLPLRSGLWPPLPERILAEGEGRMTIDDGMGGIQLQTIETSSPPHYIRYPLATREAWERLKPFFDPETIGRFPLNWEEITTSYRDSGELVGIEVGSLFGWLRNWMGIRNISVAFYRDPDWIAEMMDTLTNLWIQLIRRALRAVKVHFATWWEDMCYSYGPILSVKFFEEFMVPRYKKVTQVLKDYGVTINILDCDGDISELVPGWLDAGINCMFPCEARYTDIFQLRETYGRKILLMGGVNKIALMAGDAGIDAELKRLSPLLEMGGFIPTVDHRCPPEISYATYLRFLAKKRTWINRSI
ncbi:MAG: uroporphyrinogen decarboxylase family protein [Candidatus Bathyarchaeota archaeon]|nr:uroporphyrinogen decarboxylase family protein [Candidatus Bathyarchaeota archaeon]